MNSAVAAFFKAGQDDRYRVVIAGVCALILTVGLARFAYTPMLPIMHVQAGLSDVAGGWLATINYAGYMSGALLAASISDIRRKFVIYRVGLVLAVVSTAAMGLSDNVYVWAIWRYISGFSSTAGMLLASGLVLNWLIRHGRRQELGLHFMGIGVGISVSGLAVAALGWLPWDGQWLGLGVFSLLFFVPAWLWLPPPVPFQTAGGAAAQALAMPSKRWLSLLMASYFCAGFGYVVSATFIVAILEDLPMLAGKGSLVWVIVGVAAAPSTFLWDRVAQAWGPIGALMLAFGLHTVSTALPAMTDGAALNVLGAMLFGATSVGIVSLTLTLIGRHYPANPAKAMAKMTLSYGVAQILAPAMTGYVAAATGSYRDALMVTALVMIVGMALLQALLAESRRQAPQPVA